MEVRAPGLGEEDTASHSEPRLNIPLLPSSQSETEYETVTGSDYVGFSSELCVHPRLRRILSGPMNLLIAKDAARDKHPDDDSQNHDSPDEGEINGFAYLHKKRTRIESRSQNHRMMSQRRKPTKRSRQQYRLLMEIESSSQVIASRMSGGMDEVCQHLVSLETGRGRRANRSHWVGCTLYSTLSVTLWLLFILLLPVHFESDGRELYKLSTSAQLVVA
jgi:hypothetical protein